jgi:hypothetical protein
MNPDIHNAERAALPNKALEARRGIDGWRIAEFIAGFLFLVGTGFLLYQSGQPRHGRVVIDMRDVPAHTPPAGLQW